MVVLVERSKFISLQLLQLCELYFCTVRKPDTYWEKVIVPTFGLHRDTWVTPILLLGSGWNALNTKQPAKDQNQKTFMAIVYKWNTSIKLEIQPTDIQPLVLIS